MEPIILVIHMILAVALVGVILIQRSEGGGLGIGGGGGGMGGFMSQRGTASLLTRTTSILAFCFMMTSLTLAVIAANDSSTGSIVDQLEIERQIQELDPSPASGGVSEDGTPDIPIAE